MPSPVCLERLGPCFWPLAVGQTCRRWLAALAFGCVALPIQAFDLQGHRGARGLAPENTLPAFDRALQLGVTTLELDVGLTADGVVVVAHDTAVNPDITRDSGGQWLAGRGPALRMLTLAQLQSYDVGTIRPGTPYARTFAAQQSVPGTRMPTLALVFERVQALGGHGVRFNIETKLNPAEPANTADPATMTRALLAVIERHAMAQRVSIQSFDWRTLRLVQQLAPSIPTVYLSIQTADNDNIRDGSWTAGFRMADYPSVPAMVKAAGGAVWSPNSGAVTEGLVKQAQALGLKVIPWTVNNPADMERLIGWGVDGLITDYPDRLRTVLQSRGMPLPTGLAATERRP